jgi:hypothetical protein
MLESALRAIAEPSPAPEPLGSRPKRPFFFWFLVAAAVAFLVFFVCSGLVFYRNLAAGVRPTSFAMPGPSASGAKDFGWWESASSMNGSIVGIVDVPGPAAGKVQPGDRIVAFNGDPRAAKVGPTIFKQFLEPGSDYTIRIERLGERHEYRLHMSRWHGPLSEVITYLLISLVFCVSGLALGLLKPDDRVAQLCSLTQLLMVLRGMATPLSFDSGTPSDLEFVLNQVVTFTNPLLFAVNYDFCLRMSRSSAPEAPWRAIRYFFYAVTGAVLASQLVFFVVSMRGLEALVSLAYRHFWIAELCLVYLRSWDQRFVLTTLVASCAAIVWGYRQSRDLTHRRRIRWFAAGCVVGLAPETTLHVISTFLTLSGHEKILVSGTWGVLRWAADAVLIVIPVSLTYAILKHRLLDIRLVVRRGLRYLMARRVLQTLLILPFVGLILPIVLHPDRTLLDAARQVSSIFNLALLVLCGASLKYRSQVRGWLDRKFFRTAYRQEDILRRLISSIRDCGSEQEVCQLVSRELYAALQPRSLFVCSWRDDRSSPSIIQATASGPVQSPAAFPAGILELLEACGSARELVVPSADGAPEAAEAPELMVIPISAASLKIRGAILLGEKKSEEPYTNTDRRLLEGVTDAIGVAFENLWLKEKVDEGIRERQEVLGRLDRQTIRLLKECPKCGTCYDSVEDICSFDRVELTMSLPVERTIAQRYRLDRRIGKGGMGVVFEATDLSLDRSVAVKLMTGTLFGDRSALNRFEREARALALLNHPNIVTLYDYGRLGRDGAFLVMELLTGTTWRSELRRLGRIPPATAALWFDQLLHGLRAAHQEDVVHRDLKPENVIIAPSENGSHRLKILDFGIARILPVEKSFTTTGVVMGTTAYMSPEQLRGELSDQRSDIFSVGIMVVESITGLLPARLPDGAISPTALDLQFEAHQSGAWSTLLNVVLHSLANDREKRYGDAKALQYDLVNALASLLQRVQSKSAS